MGNCFRYLLLLLLVWSCSREQDYLEFSCQIASTIPETKAVRCTIDTLEFDGLEEKGTSDFTLSVFIDKSMTFKEALGVLKGIVDEYRRVGLKVSVPEATIFRLDTLPKWKSSSEAFYFFYNLRRELTSKGTFTDLYRTEAGKYQSINKGVVIVKK